MPPRQLRLCRSEACLGLDNGYVSVLREITVTYGSRPKEADTWIREGSAVYEGVLNRARRTGVAMTVPGRDNEEPLPWDVVIPDDISALDAEVHAFQREVRKRRRRAWWTRRILTRRWQRYGLSGPLVVLILTAVALVGSLMALLSPRQSAGPAQRPLARQDRFTPGTVGGLLPSTPVLVQGVRRDVRELRPGVFAVLPMDCRCADVVESLFRQAREFQLDLRLLGGQPQERELREIAAGTGNGSVAVALDVEGRLLATYLPRGVTAILVNGAGVVTAVERNLTSAVRLEPRLATLLRADQTP
jgi:hypothetical protein